jgi:tRNA (guanine37-N1)-methyltransferase
MDFIQSCGIKVMTTYAETLRKQLLEVGLLRTDLKIKNDKGFVYLPIKEKEKIPLHLSIGLEYEIGTFEFEVLPMKIGDYKDVLPLSSDLIKRLPTSFDVIGSIILIKLDETLQPYQSIIGEALLKTHAHITSVYRVDPVEGELRIRPIELIGGRNQTRTIHKEYGLSVEVDIKKTYFNPRLANERRYIASKVKPGEIILDMFTGVAPFPLMISRYADPELIIAIDKNSNAIKLAEKNVKRNNIDTDVRLICDDARHSPIIIKQLNSSPNRIIMNLPFHAIDFFHQAIQCIRKTAVIHFYRIGSDDDITYILNEIRKIAKSENVNIRIDKKRKIKSYAPHEFYMGIDITAKKS